MSPLQPLREFIRQRLTAAAEEIFSEVEKTIVRLEEELRPRGELTGADQQKLHVSYQEVLTDPKLRNQQRSSGLDQGEPEPPQVQQKPEPPQVQQKPEPPQEPEPLRTKQEPEPPQEPEPLQIKQEPEDGGTVVQYQEGTRLLDVCWDQQLTRTNIPEPVCKEENVENLDGNVGLDQEKPDPLRDEEEDYDDPHLFQFENGYGNEDDLLPAAGSADRTEPEPPSEDGDLELPLVISQVCSGPQIQQLLQLQSVSSQPEPEPRQGQNPAQDQPSFTELKTFDCCLTEPEPPQVPVEPSQSWEEEHLIVTTTADCLRTEPGPLQVIYQDSPEPQLHCSYSAGTPDPDQNQNQNQVGLSSADSIRMRRLKVVPGKCGISVKQFVRRPQPADRPACSVCGKRFISAGGLMLHMRYHWNEGRYECTICGRRFPSNKSCQNHRRHHGNTRKCKTCGKTFRKSAYLNHRKRHVGKGTHVEREMFCCCKCGKTFSLKKYLVMHLRSHVEKMPHRCGKCGNEFRSREILMSHMVRHTMDKRHLCEKCGRSFYSRAALLRHLRDHRGRDGGSA